MSVINRNNAIGASILLFCVGASGAFAQDEERNTCLQYNQVNAIHIMTENDLFLEVDEGTTVYHIEVEEGCFGSTEIYDVSIHGSGEDNCMRTTDRVNYGRRQCSIEGFAIIENEEYMEALLAEFNAP